MAANESLAPSARESPALLPATCLSAIRRCVAAAFSGRSGSSVSSVRTAHVACTKWRHR
jgi:hypothetical protein